MDDPQLKDGFIGVGYSQGGYVMRTYLENHTSEMPPMLRFVSICCAQAGLFCGRSTPCGSTLLSDFANFLVSELVYTDVVQENFAFANCWRDPFDVGRFVASDIHIVRMNNLNRFNEEYKRNFLEIDRLVLFASQVDGTIMPWSSAWFNFWADDSDSVIQEMEDTVEY